MRNKLIHEYFGVDIEMIWDTIQEDLSPLKIAVIKVINTWENTDGDTITES